MESGRERNFTDACSSESVYEWRPLDDGAKWGVRSSPPHHYCEIAPLFRIRGSEASPGPVIQAIVPCSKALPSP